LSTQKKLNIALIGAGKMGVHHARVLSMMRDANFVAVVDIELTKAHKIAAQYGCCALKDYRELIGKCDAAIVASSSSSHKEIGIYLLQNGIHCLVEKPLALSVVQAQNLIKASKGGKALLTVCHIEQANPAFQALKQQISPNEEIIHIDFKRFSPSSQRIIDTDVVMDLMIHDLELLLSIIDSPLQSVTVSAPTRFAKDFTTVNFIFENGTLATLSSSRVSPINERSMSVTTKENYYSLDFLNQNLSIFSPPSYPFQQSIQQLKIPKKDALTVQTQTFIDNILKSTPCLVDVENVVKALSTACMIQEQLGLKNQYLDSSPKGEDILHAL
jgi:virulence factor